MAITRPAARQTILSAYVPFTYADFETSGVMEAALDVPADAIVVGGALVITTAFNSATSDAMDVGDVGGTATRYMSGQDVKTAAGDFALNPDGVRYTERSKIGIEWTGSGTAPSAGAGYLRVDYIGVNRQNEVEKVYG